MQKMHYERDTEEQSFRYLLEETEEPGSFRLRQLRRALQEELTPRQAQMVRLHYGEKRSMKAIADELGLNPSTVSRTLKLSREKLHRCLRYCGLE